MILFILAYFKGGHKMLFMGIDIGSSGCKVSVINEIGLVVYSSARRYSFTYSDRNSELDANMIYENVVDAIKEITYNNDVKEIATLSATSFGEMFVLLDENDDVLRNSISYSDPRGKTELELFTKEFGEDRLYSITGATPSEMYSLPKLLWIKKNEPLVYSKAKKICLFADYILQKLGAEFHMDYSLAARTLMFDVKCRKWSDEILACADIKRSIFPEVVPTGSIIGSISYEMAKDLKLPFDVKLLAGGHDQSCAALGAGIVYDGMALDGMGSNECIVPVFDKPMIVDKMKNSHLACVPYMIEGKYITYAFNRTSGTVVDWYKNLIGYAGYDELFSEMEDEPSKLLCLPHFSGAATPYMDDTAVGALVGLDLSCDRKEITKGIIEGLNYEMKINLDCLRDTGFNVKQLYVSGGLSQNDKILQIKADILGVNIYRLETSQSGTMAMALLGCVAKGVYKDIYSAISNLVRTTKVFYPNTEIHERYMEQYEKYTKMYKCVKEITGGI